MSITNSVAFRERAQHCPWIAAARKAIQAGGNEREILLQTVLELSERNERNVRQLVILHARMNPTLICEDGGYIIVACTECHNPIDQPNATICSTCIRKALAILEKHHAS